MDCNAETDPRSCAAPEEMAGRVLPFNTKVLLSSIFERRRFEVWEAAAETGTKTQKRLANTTVLAVTTLLKRKSNYRLPLLLRGGQLGVSENIGIPLVWWLPSFF